MRVWTRNIIVASIVVATTLWIPFQAYADPPSPFGMVSVTNAGVPGQNSSGSGWYTPLAANTDGTKVFFMSDSTELAGVDPAPVGTQVYSRDISAGTTSLISRTASGESLNAGILNFRASNNGRYVAFATTATNVGLGYDGGGQFNIYLLDLISGGLSWEGTSQYYVVDDNGTVHQDATAVTPDGRYLIPLNGGNGPVTVTDTTTGSSQVASSAADGTPGDGNGGQVMATISTDGQKVTFFSTATNLVPGYVSPCAPNNCGAIYQKDLATGAITSITSDFANTGSEVGQTIAASDDGTIVAFCAEGNYQAPNEGQGFSPTMARVYVHSMATGTTLNASQDAGYRLNPYSFDCAKALSGDGTTVIVTGNPDLTCSTGVCPTQVYAESTGFNLTGPVVTQIAPITVQATSAAGAFINVTPTATDPVDGSLPVTCDQPLPGTYAIGTTTVTCSATNAAGQISQPMTTSITVTDIPAVNPIPPILAPTAAATAFINVTPTATDPVDGSVPVTCDHPLPGTYPLGTTIVTCTATNAAGITSPPVTVSITVQSAIPGSFLVDGSVHDPNNAPVAGLTVTVRTTAPPLRIYTTVTAANGSFAVLVAPGSYIFRAQGVGNDGASVSVQSLTPRITARWTDTIVLRPTGVFTPNVVDAFGTPITATVLLSPQAISFTSAAGTSYRYNWNSPNNTCVSNDTTPCSLPVLLNTNANIVISDPLNGNQPSQNVTVSTTGATVAIPLPSYASIPSAGSLVGNVVIDALNDNGSLPTIVSATTSPSEPGSLPPGVSDLSGEIALQLTDLEPGASSSIYIQVPQAVDGMHVVDVTPVGVTDLGGSIGGDTATFTLYDGGFGDHDGLADGVITTRLDVVSVLVPAPSILTLTSAPTSFVGQPATFTGTIATGGFGFPTPTGTVSFFDDGGYLCADVPIVNGVATCTNSDLVVGDHTITMEYGGDWVTAGSVSNLLAHTVVVPSGATHTFSGTVRTAASSPVPNVLVQVTDGASTASTVSGNDGSFSIEVPDGYDDLSVTAGGPTLAGLPSSFQISAKAPFSADRTEDIIIPDAVTLSMRSLDTDGSPLPGADCSIDVPVTGPGSPLLADGVAVSSTSGTLPETTDADGVATVLIFPATADMTATCSWSARPDLQATGATSLPFTSPSNSIVDIVVQGAAVVPTSSPQPTTIASPTGTALLNVSASPVPPDVLPPGTTSVTDAISYTVDGVSPGATIDVVIQLPPGSLPTSVFKLQNGIALDVTSLATISGDVVVLHVTDGGPGDADGVANGIIVDPFVIGRAPVDTVTSLAGASADIPFGSATTLTATVATAIPYAADPTGTVEFAEGGNVLCAAVPVVAMVATCTVTLPTIGQHNFTAHFAGSTFFNSSTSGTLTVSVVPSTPTVVLVASPVAPVVGQPVDLSISVHSAFGSQQLPTGSVTVTDGGAVVCAAAQLAAGIATCSTTSLSFGAHDLVATYTGDASYTSASSEPVSLTVGPASTSTAVSSLTTDVPVGTAVNIAGSVSVVAPGGGSPIGTLSIFDGATLLCSFNLPTAASTTCVSSSLAVGTHQVAASFAGAGGYLNSSSTLLSIVVRQPATTTSLVAAPTSAVFGQPVTLSASVAAQPPGSGSPSGAVSFLDGTTVLCTAPLAASNASCSTTALAVGPHSLSAQYSGDASFSTSLSPPTSVSIVQASSSVTLQSTSPTAVFGQPITFTARASAVNPSVGTPSGSVTFKDGAAVVCSAVSLTAGSASCASTTLGLGSHTITAVYSGDVGFKTATSPGVGETIVRAPTTTTLASSSNPSVTGQSVTFTATIGAAPSMASPTGSVTFRRGLTTICSNVTVAAGVARCSTTGLPIGTTAITATFAATGNFLSSISSILAQQVTTISTTTALTSSVNPTVTGQASSLRVTVAPVAPGAGTPTGNVTIYDGASPLVTLTLAAGTATAIRSFVAGSHTLTAVYNGTATYGASTSAPVVQAVASASTTTSLSTSSATSLFGRSVTFTATIRAVSPGSGVPSGMVTFYDGATALGTVTLNATGSAALPTSTLSRGTHSITARYNGSANYSTSVSAIVTQRIT